MRFTVYVIAKRSNVQVKSIFPNLVVEYWDGKGYWCHKIPHAKHFNTHHDAYLELKSHEPKWATTYEYTVVEHEECDY